MSGLGDIAGRVVAGIAIVAVFVVVNQAQEVDRGDDGSIVEAADVDLGQLREGDCWIDESLDVQSTTGTTIEQVSAVPCSQPHTFEVYAVDHVDGTSYPGDASVEARALRFCEHNFAPFVGLEVRRSAYEFYFTTPTKQAWELSGYRTVVCAIADPALRDTVGTLRHANR